MGFPDRSGLADYRELLDDSESWASFRHSQRTPTRGIAVGAVK